MIAQINGIIGASQFELVRDRIGEILAIELANQYSLQDDECLNLKVWNERVVPFHDSELPCINISLSRGDFSGHIQPSSDGLYFFNIDIFIGLAGAFGESGDATSRIKLHKILGICRAILENPIYKTLGFQMPSIGSRRVLKMVIDETQSDSVDNYSMGRLFFEVRCNEVVELITPVELEGNETTVKLFETDKGYFWQI